jgi:hypothetical protein
MRGPYISLTAVSKSARLFPVSWEIKYASYVVESQLYELWGRGRTHSVGVTSIQRQHLRQEQSRSLLQTEAKIQDYCNDRSHFVSYFL